MLIYSLNDQVHYHLLAKLKLSRKIMVLIYVFLASLVLIFVSLIFVHYMHFKNIFSHGVSGSLPPGRFGWPVIGESIAFLQTGRKGQPEKFIFDRINKYSSYIFKTYLFGQKTVVFCGPMANKLVFSNENKLVKSWWPDSTNKLFPPSDQTNIPEGSLKLKKFLHTILRMDALHRYIRVMDQIAQSHFKNNWENKSEVVVYPLTKKFTFLIACKVFLSVEDPEKVEKLAKPFNHIVSGIFSIPINVPGSRFNRAIKASNLVRQMITDMVKKKKYDLQGAGKMTSTRDILSHMVLEIDENGNFISDFDIANMIIGLLVGGHDSTSSVCAIIVKYLAELPHIYEEVYKEQMEIAKSKAPGEFLNWDDIQKMKYSWNVACEALRIATPIQGNFREVISDFMFNGFSVPKGWKIYWSTNSTHQNPEFFSNPQKFDPSRFKGKGPAPYTFVPFGGGPRMCPGKEYARLKILVFMYNLVKRFKFEKIIPEEKIVFDPIAIPAKGLPIRLYSLHA